jgi:pimeloyl-ACP methyl ester carboxylesterase
MTASAGRVNGLAYELRGAGPPVLLLHGLTMSRGIFVPLVDLLSRDYLCIVPDLPGHGEADPVGDEGADFATLAARGGCG